MGLIPPFAQFEPKLQMRFEMFINGIPSYIVRASDLPNIDQNTVTVDYVNTDFKIKGKSRWQDITITLYDPIEGGQSGAKLVHDWIRDSHHNSETGIDQFAFGGYKKEVTLSYLTPMGSPGGEWTLHGAFVGSSNWGNVDMSSDDLVLLELTLAYDYAVYSGS